ncbi:DoxX family membrane protein [Cellulomonas triticagri]|uniref:DoxX family membrane protein n=1 Tax=Cellulomonas triticagri TaxID=2483352 RepID=A0A3M2JQH4_9CELL|nr:DoxX family membrane protein [Cellulomonas triticagri]RMI13893.1 DoxX family membrane protein [Cellulomonas triticagri]
MKLRHLPLRLGAGAYILSSGIDKLSADEDAAKGYHGLASGAYPFLKDVDPKTFTKAVAASEVGLGAALLVPVLPRVAVATGFTAFSAALVGMYLRTPALHRGENDPRPSPDGVGIAKDVIMLGAAATYLLDTLTSSARKAGTKATKKAGKAAKKLAHR